MPVVDTTQSFATGDTVTSTTLNNIMDQSIFVAGAVVSGSGLDVTTGGQMTIADNSVPGGKITNGTITTEKITDSSVTTAKIADLAVTNSKIANSTIEKSKLAQALSIGTPQSPTLATADFTSIPSWVTRITILFDGLSTNGTSAPLIQLGDAGGIENTGYTSSSYSMYEGGAGNITKFTSTAGFVITANKAANQLYGSFVLSLFSTNKWSASSFISSQDDSGIVSAGIKTLSDALTQIRITTVGGTNVFDGGSVNIMFE